MSTESPDLPRQPPRGSPSDSVSEASRREMPQREPRRRELVRSYLDRQHVTRALGWLGVGLGLGALLAPRAVGNLTGIGPRTGLLRAAGLLGVVAGTAAANVGAIVRQSRPRSRGERVGAADDYLERSVIVGKSPQECYDYWRNLSNAPNFMRMIESVTELDERRSHWQAKLPNGVRVEWDSRISEERPGERIAWHSAPDAPIVHAGVVSFERAPGDRGTIVRWVVHYQPPVGRAGLRKLPDLEIKEDLRRFKQILETGEIATTRGQPAGRRSGVARRVGAGRGT